MLLMITSIGVGGVAGAGVVLVLRQSGRGWSSSGRVAGGGTRGGYNQINSLVRRSEQTVRCIFKYHLRQKYGNVFLWHRITVGQTALHRPRVREHCVNTKY